MSRMPPTQSFEKLALNRVSVAAGFADVGDRQECE